MDISLLQKCTGRGRQIYQPGLELGELLVRGVEAGVVLFLQVRCQGQQVAVG
jgi:hypothetical protein